MISRVSQQRTYFPPLFIPFTDAFIGVVTNPLSLPPPMNPLAFAPFIPFAINLLVDESIALLSTGHLVGHAGFFQADRQCLFP